MAIQHKHFMMSYDIRSALNDLPLLTITANTTEADAVAAERRLVSYNQCIV